MGLNNDPVEPKPLIAASTVRLMCSNPAGLKIFDACGDGDLAERQLNVLFPELADEEEQETCEMGEQSPMIGLVDFVGLTDEPEISQQLHSFSIPFMAVRLDDFLPAEEVAEVSRGDGRRRPKCVATHANRFTGRPNGAQRNR